MKRNYITKEFFRQMSIELLCRYFQGKDESRSRLFPFHQNADQKLTPVRFKPAGPYAPSKAAAYGQQGTGTLAKLMATAKSEFGIFTSRGEPMGNLNSSDSVNHGR